MKPRRGLVIGKFYPFHEGHRHLVEFARQRCDHLTVIVCWRASDTIPGTLRGQWIREAFPDIGRIAVVDDRFDESDTLVWARNTLKWMGGAPDVVFTSEAYGPDYALAMGCRHEVVDPARVAVPCSGRVLRRDPWAHWSFLGPGARAWYVRRVIVLGAESTGTTTLAQDLAAHYQTTWAPEFGRELSESKLHSGDLEWRSNEFVDVAIEQCRREDMAARESNRVLFGDTNAFATILWHRRYMGAESDAVAAIASARRYDLYLLTGDEIPFVQDGLRDGEHLRHDMHAWFEEALGRQSVPWYLMRGTRKNRLAEAVGLVDKLIRPVVGEVGPMGAESRQPASDDCPKEFVIER